MLSTIVIEGLAGNFFLATVFDKDSYTVLNVLQRPILRCFMPRQSTKLWLLRTFKLEEVHVIQGVFLIIAPVNFETVDDKVFGAELSLCPRL